MVLHDSEYDAVLDAVIEPPLKTIQEPEFRQKYLGLFHPDKLGTQPMAAWLEVSGSPYLPVNVMSGDEVLFVVPPLLDDNEKILGTLNQVNIAREVETAKLKHDIHPKLGDDHIKKAIFDRIGTGTGASKTIEALNKMYAYYKLPLIGTETPEEAAVGAQEKPAPVAAPVEYEIP